MRRTLIFLWLLGTLPSVCLPGQAAFAGRPLEPAVIEVIRCQREDAFDDGFDWGLLARALIDLKAGDLLTAEKLDQAVARLSPLAQVRAEVEPAAEGGGGGVRLTLNLRPFSRVRSIAVSGNYPLFKKEVRNAMTVAAGDIFKPEQLEAQKELIAGLYRNEGYIDPQVTISAQRDRRSGHVDLSVAIDKGPFFALRSVELSGNRAFGSERLGAMMHSWRRAVLWLGRDHFLRKELKEDIERLTSFYRSQGYADAAVGDRTEFDAAARSVRVRLVIEEGPKYDISFTGNTYFSDGSLRKELVLLKDGNRGNIGLRRSVQAIRRRYLEAGFNEVKVRFTQDSGPQGKARQDEKTRRIRIEISEGGRHLLQEVRVEGNASLDADSIRNQMLTRPGGLPGADPFVADVLQEDLTAVRALYVKHGYIDARVTARSAIDPQSRGVVVMIHVDEGPRTLVTAVRFSGTMPPGLPDLTAAVQSKAGQPFRPYLLQSDQNTLSAAIAAKGYPYVQVRPQADISADRRRADLVFQVDPEKPVRVGSIFFMGNFRTRRETMMRELAFSTGDPFSLSAVLEAQRNLRNTGLFDSVQVRTIGLKEHEETVHLLFELVEKVPYHLEAGAGYQTNKGFYGRAAVGDLNFRGSGVDVHTGGEWSQVGYRWDLGFTNPHLLGSRFSADATLFIQREELFNQEFGTDSAGAAMALARRLGSHVTTGLKLGYELREQFLRDGAADIDPATLEQRSILVNTPSILYDSRDSFIRPRSGYMAGLAVDISTGLQNTLDNFLRYKLDLRAYRGLTPRLTLAGRLNAGYMHPYSGNEDVPLDQLFYLGGTTTVRGYGENLLRYDDEGKSVGGRLAVNTSLEVRYDLGWNLELLSFVDGGTIRQAQTGQGSDDVRWSVGMGLYYATPIGPVGLAYGLKIDPRPGESQGQVHFSIGYTF